MPNRTTTNRLQVMHVTAISNEACQKKIGTRHIDESNLCALSNACEKQCNVRQICIFFSKHKKLTWKLFSIYTTNYAGQLRRTPYDWQSTSWCSQSWELALDLISSFFIAYYIALLWIKDVPAVILMYLLEFLMHMIGSEILLTFMEMKFWLLMIIF